MSLLAGASEDVLAERSDLVNGQRQPYIRNSRHEAARASALLSRAARLDVEATGVVVPVDARHLTVKQQPGDVRVVSRNQIATWLLRRPDRLPPHGLDQIYEAARRSTTWAG